MKLFIVAPVNDILTRETTAIWAQESVLFARSLGVEAIALIGDEVTRGRVEAMLAAHQNEPGLFCFFDHGLVDRFFDARGEVLLDFSNVALLKNKFIYALACSAASELGPLAISNGAAGFLGFSVKVHVPRIGNYPRLVGRCLVNGLAALLRGTNAAQAVESMRERHKTAMVELSKRTDLQNLDFFLLASILRHNGKGITLHGDGNWTWHTSGA